MKNAVFAVLLALPLVATPMPAAASTMLFNGEIGQAVTIYGPGTLANTGLSTFAGAAQVSTNNGLSWFDAYCVDLQHFINPQGNFGYTLDSMSNWGTADTSVTGPGTVVPQAWQQAVWLYTNYSSIAAASGAYYRAALQLSIWEVLFDTGDFDILGLGTSTSGFRVSNASSAASLAASTMLGALQGLAPGALTGYNADWFRTDNPFNNRSYTQDFMARGSYTPPPPPPPAPVPEPGSVVLLATGVVTLLGVRLYRRRQASLRS